MNCGLRRVDSPSQSRWTSSNPSRSWIAPKSEEGGISPFFLPHCLGWDISSHLFMLLVWYLYHWFFWFSGIFWFRLNYTTRFPESPTQRWQILDSSGSIITLTKFFFFWLFRVAPMAYESSQARGLIRVIPVRLHHSHSNTGFEPCLWPNTTAHGNARSLTYWERPGIEPASSWILVRFINTEPQWELQIDQFFIVNIYLYLSYWLGISGELWLLQMIYYC